MNCIHNHSVGLGVRVVALVILAFFAGSTGASAQGDTRVALVIGNSKYQTAGNVPTATRNASLVADTLRDLGFAVRQDANLDQEGMLERLRAFVRTARLADTAMLYYAGHALTLNDQTYLIPTDGRATSLESARVDLIALESITEQLSRNGGQNVVVLEAGQPNNFVRDLSQRLSKGAVKSLRSSVSKPPALGGVFLAGAQQPGRLYDESGQLTFSRFTAALTSELRKQGPTVTEAVLAAASVVAEKTGGKQRPWFVKADDDLPVRFNGAPLVSPAGAGKDPASGAWAELKQSNIVEEYEAFVASYPESALMPVALRRLLWLRQLDGSELERMQNLTRRRRSLERDYKRFLARYEARLDQLAASGYQATPLLIEMAATGNVTLRSRPSSAGAWLGVARAGDRRFVEAGVLGGSWLMVRLTEREQRAFYAADGRAMPSDGSAQRFGYFSARSFTVAGESALTRWEDRSWHSDLDAVDRFVDQNPDFLYIHEAIDLLLRKRYTKDAAAAANLEDEGYVGDGQLRPGLDLSNDIPPNALADLDSVTEARVESEGGQAAKKQGPKTVKLPELGYNIEVYEQEFVTVARSNLRRLPWVKTRKIATVNPDERLLVTGRVREVDWYRVRWGEGRDVYIFGELLEPFAGSELEAWQEVQKTRDPADIERYLGRFPQGRRADQVRLLLKTHRAVGDSLGSTIVAPKLALSTEVAGYNNRMLNVFPVEFDDRNMKQATRSVIRRLGQALGARVISDPQSSVPGMMIVLADIVEVRTDRVARRAVLADPAVVTEAALRDGEAGGGRNDGDRAPTHTTSVSARVNIVDSTNGSITVGAGRDNGPISGSRPTDQEVEAAVTRALELAMVQLISKMKAGL